MNNTPDSKPDYEKLFEPAQRFAYKFLAHIFACLLCIFCSCIAIARDSAVLLIVFSLGALYSAGTILLAFMSAAKDEPLDVEDAVDNEAPVVQINETFEQVETRIIVEDFERHYYTN